MSVVYEVEEACTEVCADSFSVLFTHYHDLWSHAPFQARLYDPFGY